MVSNDDSASGDYHSPRYECLACYIEVEPMVARTSPEYMELAVDNAQCGVCRLQKTSEEGLHPDLDADARRLGAIINE